MKNLVHRFTRKAGIAAVGVTSVLLALVCAGTSWGAGNRPDRITSGSANVVVRATAGSEGRIQRTVERLGGRIVTRLAIINGFSAQVPSGAVRELRSVPGVVSVTRNTALHATAGSYDPAADAGSPYNLSTMTGAQAYWRAGYTGRGVDVALIDSGVVPVDGLRVPGKIVNGPDLSFESQSANLRYMDTYGHGTFMAGLIAGRANSAVSGAYAGDTSSYFGMAPDARVLSLKVADARGNTDVSQVIAAISWVVQHRRDNGMNIRVLNISYGTDSGQTYNLDPLAFAAEQAWRKGIFVVAAAGNAGFAKDGSMVDPAYDPLLLSVGAADTQGTVNLEDDGPAAFSSSGRTRMVDLLAPGTHVVGLRDPGSFIDRKYGSSGGVASSFFRGSGTSQAAAIASGAAALVIQQRPSITPDQLKALLIQNAEFLGGRKWQGRRELNLADTFGASTPLLAAQSVVASNGLGLLELSRGSIHVSKDGVALTGEKDIFGKPFVAGSLATLEVSGSSWSGGAFNGSSWSGSSWSETELGSSWSGTLSGSSWSGSSWSEPLELGSSWSGSSWTGSSWSDPMELGSSWSGSSWSIVEDLGSSWSGSGWLGTSWG